MSEKKNGGPAFPVNTEGSEASSSYEPHPGMTLRDYFAAGFASHIFTETTTVVVLPATPQSEAGRHVFTQPAEQTAKQAYELADAMLAERAK